MYTLKVEKMSCGGCASLGGGTSRACPGTTCAGGNALGTGA